MIDIDKHSDTSSRLFEKADELALAIQREYYALLNDCREYDNEKRRRNPFIVKTVVKYLANGYSADNARIAAANELNETLGRVESVFSTQKEYYSGLRLYARKYTADKLKKSGFTAAQIAKILDISENHVYKLLRCNVKI